MIGPMAGVIAQIRRRGNPNWGRPIHVPVALATEFELQASRLHLAPGACASSRALRLWCEKNRNRVYVPEWLLEEWGITVDGSSTAPPESTGARMLLPLLPVTAIQGALR